MLCCAGDKPSKTFQKWIARNRIRYIEFDGEGSAAVYAVKEKAEKKAENQLSPNDTLKVVPPDQIEAVIERYHKELTGHADAERTYKRVQIAQLHEHPFTSCVGRLLMI